MYTGSLRTELQGTLKEIKGAGLYKMERVIVTEQRPEIKVQSGQEVLNFCANNYLGLSNNKELVEAACEAMRTRGFGLSSVRFICGTQDIHKKLERRSPSSSGPRTRSSTRRASTRTAASSR